MKARFIYQLIFAGASGILFFLSFPLPHGLSLGFVGWFCLFGLFFALENTSPKRAFLLGLVFGLLGFLGILYWVPYSMIVYAGMSKVWAYLALFLLALIMAGYYAIFALGYQQIKLFCEKHFSKFPYLALLVFACALWISLEYLRAYFPFGGFPWALLGLSQYKFLSLIQLAELGGVWMVSAVVFLGNFSLYALIRSRKKERILLPVLFFLILFLSAGFGKLRIKQIERLFESTTKLQVGIVQPNIDQSIKWSPEFFWAELEKQIQLTKSLGEKDLIIWPEASITTYFNIYWQVVPRLKEKLSQFGCYLLFGSVSKESNGQRINYYNSAFLLAPFGKKVLGRYDKIHLVPFGEYVPMQKILFWVDAIAGGATGNTTAGREFTIFDAGRFKIACVICYELIFPSLVRKFVKQGAELMSTITNDAWFGATSAPYQHFVNMVFRAVENRVYFLRSANTGISGVVDPCGKIITKSNIFTTETLQAEVRLKPNSLKTFYTKAGDWFCWLALFLTGFCFVIILAKEKFMPRSGK